MRIRWLATYLLFALSATLLSAQELYQRRDFLTDHEADLIRVAQDPNDRIKQYLHFAHLRLELVNQQLSKYKPGRSQLIHRNLEEYGRIVETIDIVIDDALVREADVAEGLSALVEHETEFLNTLEKFEENPQRDHERYAFVLDNAILITEDSIELAEEDLGLRRAEILEADRRRGQKRLESMTPQRRKAVIREEKEQAREEAEQKRKRPTLLKPGEKLENQDR